MTVAPLLMRQLDREWEQLAGTQAVRRYLHHLNDLEPNWRLRTPDQLVELARFESDNLPSVLAVLVDEATDDDLAFRIAIQVMLPRWWTIASSLSGIPIDDAIALVVSIGSRHLRECDPGTASTPIGARLWCNTRRDAIRAVIKMRRDRARSTTLSKVGDLAVADLYGNAPGHLRGSVVDAGLDPEMADVIVATRVEGHRLTDQADKRGLPAATLRQRRFRAERKLRDQLAAA